MFGRRMPLKSQNKKADSFFVASIYISNTAGWKQNAVKNFFPRKAIKKLATFPRKISNSRLSRNIRYFKISTFCARRKGLMSLVKLVSRRPQAANFLTKPPSSQRSGRICVRRYSLNTITCQKKTCEGKKSAVGSIAQSPYLHMSFIKFM